MSNCQMNPHDKLDDETFMKMNPGDIIEWYNEDNDKMRTYRTTLVGFLGKKRVNGDNKINLFIAKL